MKIEPLAILEGRSKRLPGYSYKLEGNQQYGLDVVMSADMDLNEGEMSVVIPFADGNSRDGVGDLLEVGGIRTERHQQNPIVLFDHGKQVTLPIGLAEDPETHAYTVEIDPILQTAKAKAFFYQGKGGLNGEDYDHAVFCEQLFDLMAQRYIRAGSIGYQVVKALKLNPDYERGTPEGLHLLVTLMLECSAVVLPANQDTVRKALSLPNVCGKPLSPMLVKSLSAYAPPTPTVVGFGDVVRGLRKKYEKKGFGSIPSPQNLTGYQVGETVFARSYLARIEPVTGKTTAFARTGDRLKVVAIDGPSIVVQRADGEKAPYNSAFLRRSGGAKKSVKELRQRYRVAKGLRRRMRKSVAGSSVVYLHGKDLDEAREFARGRGVQFHHHGSHQGLEKVKLVGDDAVVDEVAKRYGRRVLRKGIKSMAENNEKGMYGKVKPGFPSPVTFGGDEWYLSGRNGKDSVTGEPSKEYENEQGLRIWVRQDGTVVQSDVGKKNMGKKLTRKTKELPTDVEVGNEAEHEEQHEGNMEPYGAQVLRRLHEDHSILMKDYDEMMGPLEHEHVKKLLHKTLEDHAGRLDDIEDHFSKHYPDLPPLEGAKDLTEGEEENIEGELDNVKENLKEDEEDTEKDEESKKDLNDEGEEEDEEADSERTDLPTPEEAVEGTKELRKKYHKTKGKPVAKKKELKVSKKSMHVMEMGDQGKSVCTKAAHFLKDLSEAPQLSDEHRMEAYHHHKGLEDIGGALGLGSLPDSEAMHKGVKSEFAGDPEYWEEEGKEPEHEEGPEVHPHAQTIGEASKFLKSISTEQNFGDPHREEAMHHHKALSEIAGDEAEEEEEESGGEPIEEEQHEPGEMGEKQVALKKQFVLQQKQLKELTRTINGITSRIKV